MKKKIDLVLSGGGIRGLAHIGVLKELERNNISIRRIAASSSGAIIGALYASCLDAKKVEAFVESLSFYKLPDFSWYSQGLMKGRNIRRLVQKFIGVSNFDELMIPLVVNATDLHSGKEIVFSDGNVLEAVRASIGYPGMLTPVVIKNHILIDGGLVNPVPVSLVPKSGVTVASDVTVNISNKLSKKPHIMDVLIRSLGLLQRELIKEKIAKFGKELIYIQPDVHEWDLFTLKYNPLIIHRGAHAMNKSIAKLKRLL